MVESVYIGSKEISRYISACFYALDNADEVNIISRGSYIKKSIDILAILVRDYIENPKYVITVKSEPFENRNVSAVEIVLSGKKKENIKERKNDNKG